MSMTRGAFLTNLLIAPPVSGVWAVMVGILGLVVPTVILSLNHALPAGACCTTYFPFVMLCAILVPPLCSSAVALGAIGLADALFMGPRYQLFESPMDDFAAISSFATFALIIGLIYWVRKLGRERLRLAHSVEMESGVIFSLERGQAWASWPGAARVRLGPQDEVAEMMEDYLAQLELAERLARGPA